ncbi:MAG: O-antigen ligase family protein [Phycisphaerae bacterium]|nr:O-antigen ligase family protein [Phycisphaerae bacterium]
MSDPISPKTVDSGADGEPAGQTVVGWGDGLFRWLFVAVAALVLSGSLLLYSVPSPPRPLTDAVHSGHVSPALLKIVDFLCVGYKYPTPTNTEIKSLPLGFGVAAVAVLAAAVMILRGFHSPVSLEKGGGPFEIGGQAEVPTSVRVLRGLRLVDVAQTLLLLVVIWSVVSRAWSSTPELSLRATVILAIQAAWTLLLSRGMSASRLPETAVRAVSIVLVVVCAVAAALSLRLHGLEKWVPEAFFPIGGDRVFAACLLPGLILSCAWLIAALSRVLQGSAALGTARWMLWVMGLAMLLLISAVLGWGILIAGPRAAWLGGLCGAIAIAWLAVGGRGKILVSSLGAILLIVAALWVGHYARTSGSFDAADVRLCRYGWRYALQAWTLSAGTGLGQGGFTLSAEPWLIQDQIDDPTPLTVRWHGHANSEWLEVLADLGLVGFHLTVGVYALTMLAGVRALKDLGPGTMRWCLIGLLAALVAILAEECMDSAMRFVPMPAISYTVLACIWAALLARRCGKPLSAPAWAARSVGAALLVVFGLTVSFVTWQEFLGEHVLALSRLRLRSPRLERVAEAVDMTRRAMKDTFRPRHQAQARLIAAQAHYTLASARLGELARRIAETAAELNQAHAASRPTTQSLIDLWADPSYRGQWEKAEQDLTLALRRLEDVRDCMPDLPGSATTEAEVCQAMARLWQIRAGFVGAQGGPLAEEAMRAVQRFHKQRISALSAAMARQPFSDAVLVELMRADSSLQMGRVAELACQPLRNPMLSEEYRSVLLQVYADKAFRQTFQGLVERASQDASEPDRPWRHRFSPEVLRMAAILLDAEGKTEQAVAAVNQSLRLYEAAHNRLSVQQALTMADLAWYQLVLHPTQSGAVAALGLLNRALEVSERPGLYAALRPIYRRMMHAALAAGEEATARELVPLVSPYGEASDPNLLLAWSYEVLGRTFHRLSHDKRPPQWSTWVRRAAELSPESPDVQVLVSLMASENGDGKAAAESLERAWERIGSARQRDEFVRALMYALQRTPNSYSLRRLHQRVLQEFRASTQPAASRPDGGSTSMPTATTVPIVPTTRE